MFLSQAPLPDPSSAKKRVFELIEHIERIGFPNRDNIDTLKNLIGELVTLASHFNNSDRIAIKQLDKTLHKIEARLKEDGDIPIRMYTQFNKPLIILKTALRISNPLL